MIFSWLSEKNEFDLTFFGIFMVDLGVFMGDCGRFMGDLGIFCGRSWFRLTSADNQLVRFKMCDFLKNILEVSEILAYICAVETATQRGNGKIKGLA